MYGDKLLRERVIREGKEGLYLLDIAYCFSVTLWCKNIKFTLTYHKYLGKSQYMTGIQWKKSDYDHGCLIWIKGRPAQVFSSSELSLECTAWQGESVECIVNDRTSVA
jgi:hypothetical protein